MPPTVVTAPDNVTRLYRRRAGLLAATVLALITALVATGLGGMRTAQASDGVDVGPVTLLLSGKGYKGSFSLSTATPVVLDEVAFALRRIDAEQDEVVHVRASGTVSVNRNRTFRAGGEVLSGTFEVRPAYRRGTTWTYGTEAVRFDVGGSTASPITSPTTAPAAAPTTAPLTVGSAAGFSPGGAFPYLEGAALDAELDAVVRSGAAWVRVDFPWTTVEPTRGSYTWTRLDRVTAAAAARGLKVLALPAYSPAWARGTCSSDKCPPVDPRDYARFVAAAAGRYGPDRVQAWEIWNEPNIPSFWSPKPDVDAYARLLMATVPAVRAVRPDAYLVSAGLSPAYSDGTNVAPVDFVRRLYALGAMAGVDAVGIHPYSDRTLPLTAGTESWNTFLQMKVVYDVMAANGDARKQVWATEFGVATGTSSKSTTEAQQAAIIAQGYSRLADGTWPWLGTLFSYSLRDSGSNIADWQSNFGLRRYDGSPKPAWDAFVTAMRAPLVR